MTELSKAFEAQTIESKWYQFWDQNKFFQPKLNQKPSFCIVIPPPNVTGVLHMGHALVNTLQDVLIRWKRMQGFDTLWVPGTDHAGIATQSVVERHLIKTQGKKRRDYSREEFLKHIWQWKHENEDRIISQLKRMGCSCDWSRQRFTMDEKNNLAVRTIFKKLYDDGLIYRGQYLVNWDPITQTAISDDEVQYELRQSFLWYFKYPLSDGSGFAQVATTRPETMLGDTAIAVSPRDVRYQSLIGKLVTHPVTKKEIPIVADHSIDPEFGTGMVKITPAHDPVDYEIGLNHDLPFINIMTSDGKINENGGDYQGLTMLEAREKIVQEMDHSGYLVKKEPHENRVGISYRSGATIEPYMSKQWFVRMSLFKDKLRSLIIDKEVELIPSNWQSTYFHWIDNLRDWCISRQLWWGHRIPIWYSKLDPETILCYPGEGLPPEVQNNPDNWEQDSDVLDTWFSSALWPFAALGWPEKTEELKKFYPNSILITGHDILFFWVARMMMMGEYTLDAPPFPQVFLHGLIYGKSYWKTTKEGIAYITEKERLDYDLGKPIPKDVQWKWEKMSKSKGNVIDPIEIIEQYGTDAMRMALCSSATQAREIDLDRRKFEEFKNFANKIWNGARFAFMNLAGDLPLTAEEFNQGINFELLSLEDHWILSTMNRVVQEVNENLSNKFFDQAALGAYDFFWKEFCSYYLEIIKPTLFGKAGTAETRKNKQKILSIILCSSMRLIHPMAPFITEEIFQVLKEHLQGVHPQSGQDRFTSDCILALSAEACIIAHYPTLIQEAQLKTVEQEFNLLQKIVYQIRNIRGEMKIPPGSATDAYFILPENDSKVLLLKENEAFIGALVKVGRLIHQESDPHLPLSATGVIENLKIILPIPEELAKQEAIRLKKEEERLQSLLDKTQSQLSNEDFIKRAPQELITKQKDLLSKTENELSEIRVKLEKIGT